MSRETELDEHPQPVAVAAGILQDADGRVLVTDRQHAVTMRTCWEFPGGKLDAGEPPAKALARELREELGIEVVSCQPFHSLRHSYPDIDVHIDFFLVSSWTGQPCGMEGQQLRWLRLEELEGGDLLPADLPVIAALRELRPD